MRMIQNESQLKITYTPAEAAAARVALLISFLSVTKHTAPDDATKIVLSPDTLHALRHAALEHVKTEALHSMIGNLFPECDA